MRTTVKSMWAWLFDNYELHRWRVDRAVKPEPNKPPQDQPAVEVGYGSYTVRVRVYNGSQMLGMVDFDSREAPSGGKLMEVELLMAQATFVPVITK